MNEKNAQVEPSTSTTLIEKAIRQDVQAWNRLVQQYSPLAYNYARYLGLSPEESADVAQDALVAVFTSLERFRRQTESDGFRKWLRGIIRNKARELLRRSSRRLDNAAGGSHAQSQLSQLAFEPSSDPILGSESKLQIRQVRSNNQSRSVMEIRRALTIIRDDFQKSTWRAFWETAINGLPASEVAGELQMSAAAVRKAKSRVMERLRQELERIA